MTTNKCVYGKITKTNLVQRNSENLKKKTEIKKRILKNRPEF